MNKLIFASLAVVAALLTGCNEDDMPQLAQDAPQAVFDIKSRAGESTLSDESLRLFIADRRQEHNNDEALHCGKDWRIDLTENKFQLKGMTSQWYKFAFVSVPDISGYDDDGQKLFTIEKDADPETCDFNKLTIDYAPVLAKQKTSHGLAANNKMDVWRSVIDRWLMPDSTVTEKVTLQRITGHLALNLGVPEDQFRREVSSIQVVMKYVPNMFYIHDEGDAQVIMQDKVYDDYVFEYTENEIPWDKGEDFIITIALPPHEVTANIIVTYKKPISNQVNSEYYTIAGSGGNKVLIKPNTKTTVLFNGMDKDSYEVRYAGFDGSGIGVDGPEWDGWDNQSTK